MKLILALLFAGKLGKVLLTGGTMLISVFAYAFLYGWRYSVGFVLLLLCHEMGHFIAASRRGLDVGAPTFIPFVGAWVNLKSQVMDAETQAFVGIAGPILGSTAALIVYLVAREQASDLLMAIAYAGFVLNLFNLIPVAPLDGGHIVAVISPKIWLVGLPMLGALFLWKPSPLLLLIAIVAVPQVWAAWKNRNEGPTIVQAAPSVRWSYGVQYLLLAGFLAVMAFDVHERLRLE